VRRDGPVSTATRPVKEPAEAELIEPLGVLVGDAAGQDFGLTRALAGFHEEPWSGVEDSRRPRSSGEAVQIGGRWCCHRRKPTQEFVAAVAGWIWVLRRVPFSVRPMDPGREQAASHPKFGSFFACGTVKFDRGGNGSRWIHTEEGWRRLLPWGLVDGVGPGLERWWADVGHPSTMTVASRRRRRWKLSTRTPRGGRSPRAGCL